jgi:hypothetical protein
VTRRQSGREGWGTGGVGRWRDGLELVLGELWCRGAEIAAVGGGGEGRLNQWRSQMQCPAGVYIWVAHSTLILIPFPLIFTHTSFSLPYYHIHVHTSSLLNISLSYIPRNQRLDPFWNITELMNLQVAFSHFSKHFLLSIAVSNHYIEMKLLQILCSSWMSSNYSLDSWMYTIRGFDNVGHE